MKDQDKNDAFKKMVVEIRESKLSGQHFLQRWLPYQQRMSLNKAFRNLTRQEKITLIENIARTRFTCPNRQLYFQIFGCCYRLEKARRMQQFAREMRENQIKPTSQLIQKYWKIAQTQGMKRIRELGLDKTFDEVMQIKKSMEQQPVSKQKDTTFSEGFQQKTQKPRNKSPLGFFARLKAMFVRQKGGVRQSEPEPTMEYIQLGSNRKEQS